MVENDIVEDGHGRESTALRIGCGCSKRESVSVGRRKRRDRETGLAIGTQQEDRGAREGLGVVCHINREKENGVSFSLRK